MIKRNKKLTIAALLLILSVVAVAVGLKYFPFTKVMKLPAAADKEFVNPERPKVLPPNTLSYDFELAPGKEIPGGFYKGIAHSGQYSVQAFGQNSFSTAIERTAKEIGPENLKAVALSAWIYVFPTKNEVQASLVFTASNDLGVNVYWQGVGVREPGVPRGKWFKVSGYFDLSAVAFKPGYKLQIYFWNNSRTDILVDDYYVVFGGAVDRRGDSARVDLTKPEGFRPRPNYPPFPVEFLEREQLPAGLMPGDLKPTDLAVAGDFFNTGNDGLIVSRPDGKINPFIFCKNSGSFRKVTITNPGVIAGSGKIKKVVCCKSGGNQPDKVVILTDKELLLSALSPVENGCKQNDAVQTTLTVLSRFQGALTDVLCGDFTGDNRNRILAVREDGTWELLQPEPGAGKTITLKSIFQGSKQAVGLWNQNEYQPTLTSGKFVAGAGHDVILTTVRSKSDGKFSYTLLRLNPSKAAWEPLYPATRDHLGITTGQDTLKPTDRFYTVSDGSKTRIFRYNRDWRYDLKEIRFNDTSFTIVADVDFRGYDKDRNPKYYEKLTLIPGCYAEPSVTRFLLTGSVAGERHYEAILPDFVQIYRIGTDEK